ncbi:MAG: extracellular solute-binding protein [Clostridia bacterium]|nr:extracellular solute-binding protein [Clostridia bacterium]
MKRWSQWIQSARLGLDVRRLCAGVAWTAMLCLLALAGNAALAEGSDGLNAVCAMGEQVYLLENNVLWTLDEDLQPEERIHTFTQKLNGFCAYDGAFYFAFEDGGKVRFVRRTSDNRLEPLFDVEAERRLMQLLVTEDRLVALWQFTPEEEPQHQFNNNYHPTAYTLTGEPLELPFDEAASVAASQPYGLLYTVFEAEGTRLCAMDWDDGGTRELGVPGFIDAMLEAPDGAGLYYDDSDQLYRYDYESEMVESITLWEESAEEMKLGVVNDRAIRCAVRGEANLQACDVDSVGKELLTIVNCRLPMESDMRAVRKFEREHPGVKVKFENIPEEQLLTMLMAGEKTIDILTLQYVEVPRYVEAGALLDLNSDAELGEKLEKEWVGSQLYVWNGIRYGIPDYSGPEVPCICPNESLAQYAPEIDWENATWLDVLRVAEQTPLDITGDGVQDVWFMDTTTYFPTWLSQYLVSFERPEEICFDTEEFRALAEQYRRCVQKGVIVHWADLEYERDALPMVLFYEGAVSPAHPDNPSFFPLPSVNGKRMSPTGFTAFSVYVNSAHPELALDFLKCCLSDEAQGIEDWPEIGCAMNSEIYPVYASFSEEQKKNVEAIKQYINEMAVLQYDYDITYFIVRQMMQYCDGEITVDELVDGLQQKLQMALMG